MHNAITLESLRVLDTIDRMGSFGAAADALFKVPSALSYTVHKLESELGVTLFDRTGQRARLTAAGRMVLNQGRILLQAASRLEDAVRQLESGWETHLRIARETILPQAPLLKLIQSFNQLDKQVELQITEEVLGGTWEALVTGRCDLALGASGELPKGMFEYQPMGAAKFVFAVAREHPLTHHQGPVDPAAIREFPTVVVADSSLSSPGRSSGLLESRQVIRVPDIETKLEAQRMGIGVGFVPLHRAQALLASGELVQLPCTIPRPDIPIYMAWRKDNPGKALAWFVEALAKADWGL
jgi:DNA-binding transcriptional LysR family regulator